MEKRDIIVILVAILVVLVLALVVKPMLTGHSPILVPERSSPSPQPIATPDLNAELNTIHGSDEMPPNPPPTRDPGTSSTGRQDMNQSSTATLPLPTPTPSKMTWQPDPANPMPAIQMVDYAVINGKYSGNTSPFRIPTPYWEIHYNLTPSNATQVFSMDVVEKGKEDRIIRTITYRPGKEQDPAESRFFEGGQDYFLNITAKNLDKYQVTLQIPIKYTQDS